MNMFIEYLMQLDLTTTNLVIVGLIMYNIKQTKEMKLDVRELKRDMRTVEQRVSALEGAINFRLHCNFEKHEEKDHAATV